ncbi:hypothetical protein [Staphylococcus caeli]|uniref:Uncharacterized protein n=1 Tax=Staphylococcus caeli TaxID=2201815 RepID=A0A1D4NGQ9_9STAP|nr:hypothetical protein [Staphylococcus caeli]AWM30238.1 hypothetical protein SCC82B_00098 [Staphylococcus caeli]SCT09833.1 Uncharacterised protein [Staphylococcus caeli]SCT13165.1 Uncharacterised protein [Staphylococcus caeli]
MKYFNFFISIFTFIFIVIINYFLFENHNLITFFLFNLILPSSFVVIANLILSNKKRYKAILVILNTLVLQFLLNFSIILNSFLFKKIIDNTEKMLGENGNVQMNIQESSLAQYSFTYILLVALTLGISYLLEFIKRKINGGIINEDKV